MFNAEMKSPMNLIVIYKLSFLKVSFKVCHFFGFHLLNCRLKFVISYLSFVTFSFFIRQLISVIFLVVKFQIAICRFKSDCCSDKKSLIGLIGYFKLSKTYVIQRLGPILQT